MAVTGFEQFAVGQVFTSPERVIGLAEIKAFATQFDPQPQHTDEAAAAGTLFGRLVASGWHTAAFTMRLVLESALAGVSGRGLGIKAQELVWSAPVYPEEALHAVSEVLEVRRSRSKPDRGTVVFRTVTRNAAGHPVQEMTTAVLVLDSTATL